MAHRSRIAAQAAAYSAASLDKRRKTVGDRPQSPTSGTSPSPAAKERLAALLASGQPLPKQVQETLGVLQPQPAHRKSMSSSAPRNSNVFEVKEAAHSPKSVSPRRESSPGLVSPTSKRDDETVSISSTQLRSPTGPDFKRGGGTSKPSGFWSHIICCS
eukprot:EG_transcript_35011